MFGVGSNTQNPHVLSDNVSDAPYPFILYKFPSVTDEDNTSAAVPAVVFRDFMSPELDADVRKLEWWASAATLHPEQVAITYAEGSIVVHQGTLYRALAQNADQAPDRHEDVWQALPPPADDVRLADDSPHAGLGVRWPPAIP